MELRLLLVFCYLLFSGISNLAFSQSEEVKVFEKVESMATTDQRAFQQHIRKKSQLPDSIQQTIPSGTYKVSVQFVIDKHGYMGQFKVKSDPGYGLANRAIQAVQSYPGIWKPASQCGRLVNAYRVFEVEFLVKNEK